MHKKIFLATIFCVVLLSGKSQVSEIFTTSDGAIHGYDPVSYFTSKKPVRGNESLSYKWKGADWHFSSRANLDSFRTHPEKYEPQFGGYCAYGLAQGHKASTDPQAWSLVDGKLYLNYDRDIMDKWRKKQVGYIIEADKNWPQLKNKD